MARAKRRNGRSAIIGICLVALGGATLTAGAVAPESVEALWGTARAIAVTLPQTVTGVLPEVSLGGSGSEADLDVCDGTFTRMTGYQNVDAPPVWAAHNNCGGDVILPWQPGQQFRIDGDLYVVVDTRQLPKYESTPDDLEGLDGDLALQTCLYGEPVIAFVGAERSEG